jgi:flagellar hook-basal body complex protein FliE
VKEEKEMEAKDIFIVIPGESPDQPHRQVDLQTAFDAFFSLALDLKTQTQQNAEKAAQAVAAVEQWPGLVTELITAVEKIQTSFDGIGKELRGTAVVASSLATRPKRGGMN